MNSNYIENSTPIQTVLFDVNQIISTISNYFNKTSLKYAKTTGLWFLKGSHNEKTKEIFGFSTVKHISFLYEAVYKKLNLTIIDYHFSELQKIKGQIQKKDGEYIPIPIAKISLDHTKITRARFSQHSRMLGEQYSLQKTYINDNSENWGNFYKNLGISKKYSAQTEGYLSEIFSLNKFGDPALMMINSAVWGKSLKNVPQQFKYKYNLKSERAIFSKREIFFNVDGVDAIEIPRREEHNLFYYIPRFLRDFNGNIINDKKKNKPIKYPKLKAPNDRFKTPTFVAYSNEDRKKVDDIFLVEGMKDFATMIDIVLDLKIENFAIILILGVAEFPKLAQRFGARFLKAKIHLMADDDFAGQEAINTTYRKVSKHIRKRVDYLDWKIAMTSQKRVQKYDITDYREADYKFKMDHLSNIFQFSKKDIEKANQEKSRNFSKIIPEKGITNLTQFLESKKGEFLKESLLFGDKRLILQSPMGSGKSHILKNWLPNEVKKKNDKEINIVFSPLKSLRDELFETGHYQDIAYFTNSFNDDSSEQQFVALTIQALNSKEKQDILMNKIIFFQKLGFKINFWIDEAHIHSNITKNIRFLYLLEEKLKVRLILLSATAKLLFMRDWGNDKIQKFDIQLPKLKFKSLENIFCNDKSDFSPTVLKKIQTLSGKVVIMLNSDIESVVIKEQLQKSGRNPQIINALTRNTLNFNKFDTFIVTSITEFGLNFFGSNIDYLIGVNLAPFSLIQFIGRFRDRPDAKIIHIQKEKSLNINSTKIMIYPKESSSFEYKNENMILNLEQNIFQEILENSSNQGGQLSKMIKKVIPNFQNFVIETVDKRKDGQMTAHIYLKGSIFSPALEHISLDKRGETFDNILLLEDRLKVNLNSFLFDQLISEYVELSDFTMKIAKKDKELKQMLTINKEEVIDRFIDIAISEKPHQENGVAKAQNILKELPPEIDSEIFYKNHFNNSSTTKIYKQILFSQAVLLLNKKYGEDLFYYQIKKEILFDTQLKAFNGYQANRLLVPLLAMFGKPLSYYDKKARHLSGLMTFPKAKRQFITDISKYMSYLKDEDFAKFNLQSFDKSLIQDSVVEKYISENPFFQKVIELLDCPKGYFEMLRIVTKDGLMKIYD